MNIIAEIKEEMKAAYREPSGRDLTVLALLFLCLLSLIGGYKLWRGGADGWYWIGLGVLLGAARLITPLFRQVYVLWIKASVIIGFFVSRILLTLIFFLILTPTGLIMRVFGKDPMDRKCDPSASTYWIKKEPEGDVSLARYRKQF